MNCPKCGKKMINLGNISRLIFASNPPQYDVVYVCDDCKIKKITRIRGTINDQTGGRNLDEYN